jgi:hypothetical protein
MNNMPDFGDFDELCSSYLRRRFEVFL